MGMLPERFVERTLADWGEVEGGAFVISRPPLKIVPEGGRGRYGDG